MSNILYLITILFTDFPRGEGVYGEKLADLGEVDDVISDDDDLNDSSQKPILISASGCHSGNKQPPPASTASELQWRANYSGSSSLSSFSYSPRSNNSSVSSHGKKLCSSRSGTPPRNKTGTQNGMQQYGNQLMASSDGSLRSNGSFTDKNSVDS